MSCRQFCKSLPRLGTPEENMTSQQLRWQDFLTATAKSFTTIPLMAKYLQGKKPTSIIGQKQWRLTCDKQTDASEFRQWNHFFRALEFFALSAGSTLSLRRKKV
jgi:hypothetical protein